MTSLKIKSLESIPGNNVISIIGKNKLKFSGSVVQTAYVVSSPTRYGIASQDLSAIPELEINFTPKFADSIIILTAMLNGCSQHVTTYGFLRNGSPVIQNINTNSNGSISTVYDGQDIQDYMYNQYIEYKDLANGTATINYKAACSASWAGGVRTTYINDRAGNDMRSVSSMTIMEIAQ